jgi:hypothetical protein
MTQTISRLYGSPEKAAAAAAEIKKHPEYAGAVHVAPSADGTRVTAHAPFGSHLHARSILEAHEPVDSDVDDSRWDFGVMDDPAPLSHFFKLPVLTNGKPWFGSLLSSDWSFSGRIGWPMLSEEAAPLSDKLKMPVLSKSAPSWPFFLLSRNPAPLSSAIGMPTLAGDPGASP